MTDFFTLEWAGTGALLSITLAVALLESLAIIGLLLPGVALLFILASAAAHQGVEFHWLLMAASTGAFIGDSLSFFLGRHFNNTLLHWGPIQNRPELFQRSQDFCKQHGLKSLLIGRFVGPLRPFVPITAGALQFPTTPFIIIALIGAILWAPVYLGPGYYLGHWPGLDGSFWLLIILLIAIPEGMISVQKKLVATTQNGLIFAIFTITPVLVIGLLLSLEKITTLFQGFSIFISEANTAGMLWLTSLTHLIPKTNDDHFIVIVHTLSNTANTLPVFCILGFIFWQLQKRSAFKTAFILLLAIGLPFLLNLLFDIDRFPGDHLESAHIFPSSHTYFAFLVASCLQFLGYLKHSLICRLIVYWAFTVAISRIVLGLHWPLDILGSYLLALGLSFILQKAYTKENLNIKCVG